MNLLLKSTLRLFGMTAGAYSGLTLSGAFYTALKGRSLSPPNGSIKDPARLQWHEVYPERHLNATERVKKVDHYYLLVGHFHD